jgi:hypothetical protein
MARTNNSRNLNRLSGLHPLAYMGVEPTSPPQLVVEKVRPTPHNYKGFNIGTLWVVENTTELWILVGLSGDPLGIDKGWWTQVGTGGSATNSFRTNTGHDVTPELGLIHILGGTNIQTTSILGPQPNCVTITLNDNVTLAGSLNVASLTNGVVFANNAGLLSATNGTNGQVIIGGGTEPQWASLVPGANITLTPGPNTLTISALGGGGGSFGGLTANDTNVAIPDIGNRINVVGDGVVTVTSSNVASTLQIGFTTPPGDDYVVGFEAGAATWKQMASSGGSVTITETPTTINFEAAGVAALTELDGDLGAGATPLAGVITLAGVGGLLYTDAGTIPNTVEIGIVDPGVKGQVLISSSVGLPAWASLTPGAGISITDGDNQIVITNTGGGGGGGLLTVPTDSGIGIVTAGGTLNLYFGDNTNTAVTTTTVPNDTLSVNLNKWIIWPNSDAAATQGGISLGGTRFMHNLGAALAGGGSVNTFLGSQAGNHTLTTGTAVNNVGIGAKALFGLSTGYSNVAIGVNALGAAGGNTTYNSIAIGHNALSSITGLTGGTMRDCIAIGVGAMAATKGDTPGVTAYPRYSVAIGTSSQAGADPVWNNTSVGYESLKANGTDNSAFGFQSLKLCTGTDNTAVGVSSNVTAIDADYTVSVGSNSKAMYNYGVAIGASANAGSLGGVAVGYQTICGAGDYNVAIGYRAKCSPSTGGTPSNNISIGAYAGISVTLAGNDGTIYIGNPGANGDSYGIRIGTTVHQKCYVGGIYGKPLTPGLLSAAVYVDSDGKLGTGVVGGQPAFLARQTGTLNNIIGDGITQYFLGSSLPLVEDYDIGNNFTVGGGGIPARFTAPTAGLYHLEMTVLITGIPNLPPPPPPPTASYDPLWIRVYTAGGAYAGHFALVIKPVSWSATGYESLQFSATAYMAALSYATFSAILLSPSLINNLGIGVLPGTTGIFTWVSGYMISPG